MYRVRAIPQRPGWRRLYPIPHSPHPSAGRGEHLTGDQGSGQQIDDGLGGNPNCNPPRMGTDRSRLIRPTVMLHLSLSLHSRHLVLAWPVWFSLY